MKKKGISKSWVDEEFWFESLEVRVSWGWWVAIKGKTGVVWEMTKREINVWKRGAQRLGKDVFLAIGSQLCMWVIAKDWSDSFSVAAKRNDMEVAIAIDNARMELI